MILMFPVTQGTLHLIGKLSMVFLLLQAGCLVGIFPRNGLLRLSQSQGPPQTGFYFCCASNVLIIMNLNFVCLVRLEHRDMHMQRKLIMIILSSWLRLAIRIGMFPRHGLLRLCIYAAQM